MPAGIKYKFGDKQRRFSVKKVSPKLSNISHLWQPPHPTYLLRSVLKGGILLQTWHLIAAKQVFHQLKCNPVSLFHLHRILSVVATHLVHQPLHTNLPVWFSNETLTFNSLAFQLCYSHRLWHSVFKFHAPGFSPLQCIDESSIFFIFHMCCKSTCVSPLFLRIIWHCNPCRFPCCGFCIWIFW